MLGAGGVVIPRCYQSMLIIVSASTNISWSVETCMHYNNMHEPTFGCLMQLQFGAIYSVPWDTIIEVLDAA